MIAAAPDGRCLTTLKGRRMKSKVAVLTVLAATLVLAPMIASAKTRHHHHHHHHHHHPAARLK
jgi:hypothetical protein